MAATPPVVTTAMIAADGVRSHWRRHWSRGRTPCPDAVTIMRMPNTFSTSVKRDCPPVEDSRLSKFNRSMTKLLVTATAAAATTEYRSAIGILSSMPTCFNPFTKVTVAVTNTAAKM